MSSGTAKAAPSPTTSPATASATAPDATPASAAAAAVAGGESVLNGLAAVCLEDQARGVSGGPSAGGAATASAAAASALAATASAAVVAAPTAATSSAASPAPVAPHAVSSAAVPPAGPPAPAPPVDDATALHLRESRSVARRRRAAEAKSARAAAAVDAAHDFDAPRHVAGPVLTASGVAAADMYGTVIPRTPLLDILRQSLKPARLARIESVLATRTASVEVLVENLRDPHNGAAVLRTAEGLGIQTVHAVEAYDPFRYGSGVTKNADQWLSVRRYGHVIDAVEAVRARGMTLVATCLDDDAVPIDEVDFPAMGKVCVMLGNEERGLSQALRDAADVKVFVPMVGFSQSFNISVTAGMFLFHLRSVGMIKGDLADADRALLYERWVVRATKRATSLIRRHGIQYPEY